jgi:hypothetical protein
MKLNKVLAALTLGLAIAVAASCTNEISLASRVNVDGTDNSVTTTTTVRCWSGGFVVVDDTTNEYVKFGTGGVVRFKSGTTGKYIRTTAACVATEQ